MKEENVILNLNLSDLSKQPGAQHIDNKLILIDNFDYSEMRNMLEDCLS